MSESGCSAWFEISTTEDRKTEALKKKKSCQSLYLRCILSLIKYEKVL